MAIVLPGDDVEQTARDLLSLATSPSDVVTNTDDGLVFVVPDALAQAYAGEVAQIKRPRARKEV